VVTFNVKLGRAVDRAIEVLESDSLRGADVVALQEMDEPGSRGSRALFGSTTSTIRATCIPRTTGTSAPRCSPRGPSSEPGSSRCPTSALRLQQRVATAQVRTIIDDAARTTAPVVIAGDFNSYDIGPVLRRAGYRWTTELVGPSISLFSWDHIFVRGLAPASPASVGMVRQVHGASDHRPVWAVMQGDSRGS